MIRAAFAIPALAGLLLTACAGAGRASPPALRLLGAGTTAVLAKGDRVQLAGAGQLTYLGLTADSRCAPDVQCIWAGDAEAGFRYQPTAGTVQEFKLHTNLEPRAHALEGGTLALDFVDRTPSPRVTLRWSR